MSGFPVTYAERIKTLPPYLFAAIDDMKQQGRCSRGGYYQPGGW